MSLISLPNPTESISTLSHGVQPQAVNGACANTTNVNHSISHAAIASSVLKILLVDDEPNTVQLVRRILQSEGHEVYEAFDGQQALELFREVRPDLILLDAVIPKIHGMDVLKEIRKQDHITGIIFFSALTSDLVSSQATEAGADDFVNKPFTLKTLRMHIRRVLDKVQLRRQNAELQAKLMDANEKLSYYMAPTLRQTIVDNPNRPKLGGVRQIVSVLFVDICNFTTISQNLPPDEVLQMLNKYFDYVSTAVIEHGGMVDKIMGDGFMALFNAPTPQDDHAMWAMRSAIAIHQRATEWNKHNYPALHPRIGIHTGEAVVGNIGTSKHMNYTAIGDTVNLAKRLEEYASSEQIWVSAETYRMLDINVLDLDDYYVDDLGPTFVKGRRDPVGIYRLSHRPFTIDLRQPVEEEVDA